MKRIFSVLLSLIIVLSMFSFSASATYNSDYTRWQQSESSDATTRGYGCLVVAQAIMIRDSGVDTSSSFNPDVFMQWEKNNGYLGSDFCQTSWYSAQVYASQKGYSLLYIGQQWSDALSTVSSNIQNGYYSILCVETEWGTHYTLVNNVASAGGTIYCYNWGNPTAYLWNFATSVNYVLTFNPVNTPYKPVVHTHSYSSSVTTQPTCTTTGVRTYTCSCGSTYTESIAALGHNYVTTVYPVTVTSAGYTQKVCSRCKDTVKSNIIAAPTANEDGWTYCYGLPSEITSPEYIIQYNNYYEKIQSTSPGSDWTYAGVVQNEWVNSGSTYSSYRELSTSDSRVLVDRYFYHYCGASTGAYSNYEPTSAYVHWDSIAYDKVTIASTGTDNDDSTIKTYILTLNSTGARLYCQSGVTCDGSAGTHGQRACGWYLMNVYQDRVKVEKYKYTKESGWGTSIDSSATTVQYRWKPNGEEYTVSFDANGGTGAPSAQTKFEHSNIILSSTTPTRDGYTFLGWATDKNAENAEFEAGATYSLNGNITLYAVWQVYHEYTDTVTPPTCISKGYTTHKCKFCDDTYIDTYTDELGHDFKLASVKPACECVEKHLKCSRCSATEVEEVDSYLVPDWTETKPEGIDESLIETKTQYSYSTKETTVSTTDVSGWTKTSDYTWIATSNGTVDYVESFPTGFDTSNTYYTQYNRSVANTESGNSKTVYNTSGRYAIGYLYYHWCSPSYSYVTTPGDYLISDHNEYDGRYYNIFHVFYSPTYYSIYNYGVVKLSNSSVCNASFWWMPAITVYSCPYTNYVKQFTYEHWTDYSDWQDTAVTADSNTQVKTRTLYRCTIVPTGHSYTEEVTEPTCLTVGYTTHTCGNCGDIYRDSYVPALDHDWGEWHTVTEPTANTAGLKERTCTRCEEKETEKLPALIAENADIEITDKGITVKAADRETTGEVIIPASVGGVEVNSVQGFTFMACENVTSVTMPDTLTSVNGNSFYGCSALTTVTLSENTEFIGCAAFDGCESLTEIVLPDKVKTIGMCAFFNCNGLTSITLSANVTSIGEDAFRFCDSLKTVYFKGTKAQWNGIAIASGNETLQKCNVVFVN